MYHVSAQGVDQRIRNVNIIIMCSFNRGNIQGTNASKVCV